MVTIYKYDSNGYFTGVTRQQSAKQPIPPLWTHKQPTGTEGERFVGNVWQVVPLPSEPIPDVVSRFQARAALHQAGLLAQVQTIMEDPETDTMTVLAWQDATEFRRSSPTVAGLAGLLSLDDAAVDDLFRTAAAIEA